MFSDLPELYYQAIRILNPKLMESYHSVLFALSKPGFEPRRYKWIWERPDYHRVVGS